MTDEPTNAEMRRSTAVHEAGHAVVAVALGLKVAKLLIKEDDVGRACIEEANHLPVVDRVVIRAAGVVAQEMLGTQCGTTLHLVTKSKSWSSLKMKSLRNVTPQFDVRGNSALEICWKGTSTY